MTHPTALAAYQAKVEASMRRRLRPPPRLLVSEWSDRYRMLSSEASAEPGRWITERAPYQREPMDVMGDPAIERVVLMWASQTGKTEMLLNLVGYGADLSPGPVMMVQPTIEMAEAYSKDRIAPMIRDTPRLRSLFGDATSRSSGNTLRHKAFAGGQLTMAGSNSSASLAGRPIRVLLLDEVDRYPASAGTEGDPVTLAVRRTQNFPLRKIVLTSTPTVKGESRIEEAFLESDQRYRFIPCPLCQHPQRLAWPRMQWVELREPCYQCERCDGLIGEEHKHRMDKAGEWVVTNPGAAWAGFHLNALYSPWARWADLVEEWHQAQSNLLRLQPFCNTVLGETWEDRGERVGLEGLSARREQYPASCPPGVVAITAGIDVQADRIEVFHRGWGRDEESWLLGHHIVPGDVTVPGTWDALDEAIWHEYVTVDGEVVTTVAAGIDSGAFNAAVLRWATPRLRRGVFILKGGSERGQPLVSRKPTINRAGSGRVWLVGTDTTQARLYGQLRIVSPGSGFIHLPEWLDDEVIVQFTAEVRRLVKHKNRWVKRWELPRGMRNEAADCFRYADAARELANLSPLRLAQLATKGQPYTRRPAKSVEATDPASAPMESVPVPRKRLVLPGRGYKVGSW